jgi:hypothetical protein
MITLSGDTGISNISNAVLTGNLDLSKLNAVNALPGSTIQVVQTVMSNTFSVSGSTFTEVTPLTTAITPLFSNSKILVLMEVKAGQQSYLFRGKLLRNGVGIALGAANGSRPLGSISLNMYASGVENYNVTSGVTQFLDSISCNNTLSLYRFIKILYKKRFCELWVKLLLMIQQLAFILIEVIFGEILLMEYQMIVQ